ncbi:metal ABC transporter ATP-binding protein [Alkalibacillus haloalkaliphilus]|uniref:metal ABC transporter ATP-binding protein n=1 Tax=Alkalibacillus haloalkaliphilus TaxID=94136 RepID=UPI0029366608|nr:metal ABC transporter ATP-binding protein [Alkalibacillus haloalkaliphilus]MDV2582064.1 metal ABC transporter ATP-binding protein [Alkalibacillus haloalkaliphilus]
MANLITVNGVTHRYDKHKVLEDVSFTIEKGSFVGLVGPNGSGKTTIIKLILGLEKLQKGSIEAFDKPIEKFHNKGHVSFVSQKANSFSRGFPATAKEVVSMGLTSKVSLLRPTTKKYEYLIFEALDRVNMMEYANHNIGDLSGGQQQRIFIARAIVNNPSLLILDEPTVGVDTENVEQFYQLLSQLNEELGITLILVSHDIGTITTHVTDLLCLNKSVHYHGNPSDFEHMTDVQRSKIYGHDMHTITHDH